MSYAFQITYSRISALTCFYVQFHPDVNKDADANEKFMSVRHAYEVMKGFTSLVVMHVYFSNAL